MYNLPEKYQRRENPEFFDDTPFKDEWQDQVYKIAREVFARNDYISVLDYGCGSGYKLLKWFSQAATTGVDLPKTVAWLRKTYPDRLWLTPDEPFLMYPQLVVCSDVIEHVQQPDVLLKTLLRTRASHYVLSTPLRKLGDLGPPRNPCHAQEWNLNEFLGLVREYFNIESYHAVTARDKDYSEITTVIVARPI